MKASRATFEVMRLPHDSGDKKLNLRGPKGPFEVEVYEDLNSKRIQWKARMRPTNQPFGNRGYASERDCQNAIAALFEVQTSDWRSI